MKGYHRIMLGRKSVHAEECRTGSFIGANFNILEDLTGKLPEEWRKFNRRYVPVFLVAYPGKSRIGAGLRELTSQCATMLLRRLPIGTSRRKSVLQFFLRVYKAISC